MEQAGTGVLQGRVAAASDLVRMLQGLHVAQNTAASRAIVVGGMHQ